MSAPVPLSAPEVRLHPRWVRTRFTRRPLAVAETVAAGPDCPACGRPGRRPFIAIRDGAQRTVLERSHCAACGHIAGSRGPSGDWLDEFYRASFETSARPPETPPVLDYGAMSDLVLPRLPDDPLVLDLGCGYGSALAHLERCGVRRLVGLEPSERRAAVARRLGHPVACVSGDDMLGAPEIANRAPFDAVVSWHVFEHLADPAAVLANVARLLRPGGLLFVAVPHAEAEHLFHMGHYVPHVQSFCVTSLAALLARTGFEVVEHDDSIRIVAVRREDPPSAPPPTVAADLAPTRLRAKFLRDFGLRRVAEHAGEALLRFSDYSGSHEVLEPSRGQLLPLAALGPRGRLRLALPRQRPAPAARAGFRVVEHADGPRLEVDYEGDAVAAWVK